jgi:hypothetical protein
MTTSLAALERLEDCATVAQPLADLGTYVTTRTEMDGEVLGEYIERNWDLAVGNVSGLMSLVKEMKRRFKLLDRKKGVDGKYKTIRGFTSFDGWFTSFTGKSRRLAYYLLESEEQKHKRNAERRSEKKEKKDKPADTFVARIADAKKKLTNLQRQRDNPWKGKDEGEAVDFNALYEQTDPNPTITSVIQEVLALIAPKGYVISHNDNGTWSLRKEANIIIVTPEMQKAKRSEAAKKAAVTRAAKKALVLKAVDDPYGATEIAPDGKETAELLETFGAQPTDASAPTPDETEDSHIEIKGGIFAGAPWCGETKSRVKVSPKKATCEECIRRHADWESDKAAKSVAKPKVHFLTEEMVIDGKVYGETLACHPSVKPKPKQLTTSDWSKVTCARCKSSNTE